MASAIGRISALRCFALIVTVCSPCILAHSSVEQDAREILDATGVEGGIAVQIGCGAGELAAALGSVSNLTVQGLDADAGNVRIARERIQSMGIYGRVSIERLDGRRLPYSDNMINLVVSEDLGGVPMREVLRVLCPNGIAYVKQDGKWTKAAKPWPSDIDEWTHYLYDASGNAVSHDTIAGPPRRLQWVAAPRWSRHHDHMSSVSAVVSAKGRIFSIIDEGSRYSILSPSSFALIARDAFNGSFLWKRDIETWHTHMWKLKSGPAQLPRRLVAVGDRVYVTLGIDAPLTALDAATGKTVRKYANTEGTEEILYSGGVLFALIDRGNKDYPFLGTGNFMQDRDSLWWDKPQRELMALDAESGKELWTVKGRILPLALAVDDQAAYFHDGEKLVCVDRKNGSQLWTTEPTPRGSNIFPYFAPTLVVQDGVVVFSGGKAPDSKRKGPEGNGENSMFAYSAKDGAQIWEAFHPANAYKSPEDVFVTGGMVWTGATFTGQFSGTFSGYDLKTGELKREYPPTVETYWFHHRCHRAKATDRYFITSRTGLEFVDAQDGNWEPHHWVRGACLYGIMPANGLIYTPPHPCACYMEAKTTGFNALAPASSEPIRPVPDSERLEQGPAFGKKINSANAGAGDWPTYRGDAERSGSIATEISPEIEHVWEISLDGKITQPVVADGKVIVAKTEAHQIVAMSEKTGKPAWTFTAGGRIDSPPAIHQGRVLFGSADGSVYCLAASGGELIWRFLAAPEDRRIMSYDQIESVWPVSGSPLVLENSSLNGGKAIVYFVAGRSMFLDGGLLLYGLDAETGRVVLKTVMDDRDPETAENLQTHVMVQNLNVALPDVLSSDGERIFMRSQAFDLEGKRLDIGPVSGSRIEQSKDQRGAGSHLFSPTGFLDDSGFHRSYWLYGKNFSSGWNGYYIAAKFAPAGRILSFNDAKAFSFGRTPKDYQWTTTLDYHLFSSGKQPPEVAKNSLQGKQPDHLVLFDWSTDSSLLVSSMVLAKDKLFIAGPPKFINESEAFANIEDPAVLAQIDEQTASLEGRKGGLLCAVSTSDGAKLAEYRLESPPVFDGMIAANGRLYISLRNGKLLCYEGKPGSAAVAAEAPKAMSSQLMYAKPPRGVN
jgi:outer membrane protein assembly factor BamB